MNDLITNRDINSLRNLGVIFTALSHNRLTTYITSDELGRRKTEDLPQWFGLLHNIIVSDKRLVFTCSPIKFAWNIKQHQLEANQLIVKKNVQFYHQQWDEQPRQFERHVSGIVARLNDYMEGTETPGTPYQSWRCLGNWWYVTREGMRRRVYSTAFLKITHTKTRRRR